MAQLSRPYQLALVAIALLAAVWVVALRGHSSSGGSGSGSSTAPARSAPKAPSSNIYHGSAPGVQGLTKDIAKARGAVATSQRKAKELQEKSAQASSATPPASSTSTTSSGARAATPPASATGAAKQNPSTAGAAARSNQQRVEAELAHGDVVVIMFLNPKGADDRAVRREAQAIRAKGVAVHESGARQVASYGSITRGVQVYSTPTVLVIDHKGQTTVITGFTDSYSLKQAVSDARHS